MSGFLQRLQARRGRMELWRLRRSIVLARDRCVLVAGCVILECDVWMLGRVVSEKRARVCALSSEDTVATTASKATKSTLELHLSQKEYVRQEVLSNNSDRVVCWFNVRKDDTECFLCSCSSGSVSFLAVCEARIALKPKTSLVCFAVLRSENTGKSNCSYCQYFSSHLHVCILEP